MLMELAPPPQRIGQILPVNLIERPQEAASLLAGAMRFLDEDVSLTRHYLQRLSLLIEPPVSDRFPRQAILPERSAKIDPSAKGGLARWQVHKVTQYIDHRLNKGLITEELAVVARLSAGHFARAFKASMGEPPHAYIIRQRIRRAQILMLETRDTLSQIACACGLTDQAHLTRLFRRIIGTTPMVWRRHWQSDASVAPNPGL